MTINAAAGPAGQAYLEAARRLGGETKAPVAIPDEKKTFFTRLFGRRAA